MASVPSTTESRLLQFVRNWVLEVLPIDAERVLISQKGQLYNGNTPSGQPLTSARPELPYLVISTVTSDVKIGYEDRFLDSQGNLQIVGPRTATVDIQGHGLPTHEWLAHLGLRTSEADTITVNALPGITDLSALSEEDYIEARYSKEFELIYAISSNLTIPIDTVGTVEVTRDFGNIIVEDI